LHKLLVLDTAFAFEAIRNRGLEESITCRDLDGFFEHVWSVHPFATLVTPDEWTNKYGVPEFHSLSKAHTFVDGKMGRFHSLRGLPPLNFLVGQVGIMVSLVRLVRREKISVIRAGDPLYLGMFGWLLSRICGIPLVIRIGANYDKTFETTGRPMQPRLFFARRVEKIVERFVLPRAELVAGANQDNLDFALANGARQERSTLFRYGNLIDRRHFTDPRSRTGGFQALTAQLGRSPKRFLLYVGRLEKIKQPEDVLHVLAEVRRRGHDVEAILVGDGSMRAVLSELARELGIGEQVTLCGNQSQLWLSVVMPLAAVIVSPHTGRALSEAALGAAPIVAYDVDWQAELITSGVTGELVQHCDQKGLAEAVHRLLSDPVHAYAMGDAARARALLMLSRETLNQHERNQYTLLLDRF